MYNHDSDSVYTHILDLQSTGSFSYVILLMSYYCYCIIKLLLPSVWCLTVFFFFCGGGGGGGGLLGELSSLSVQTLGGSSFGPYLKFFGFSLWVYLVLGIPVFLVTP